MQTLSLRDMFGGHLPSVRIKTWRQEMESTSLATDFKSSALNSQMSWLENGLSPNSHWWSLIIVILVLNMVHQEIVEGIVWFHVSWVFAGILGDTMWYSTYMTTSGLVFMSVKTWWDLMRLLQFNSGLRVNSSLQQLSLDKAGLETCWKVMMAGYFWILHSRQKLRRAKFQLPLLVSAGT